MEIEQIEDIVIVGGGTAGWIAAASMAKLLGNSVKIRLIESDAIGTVGVGEATIPQIRRLNAILGIDEREFLRETQATFKLGIEFNNWGGKGESYFHSFGDAGINLSNLLFHQYWLRSVQEGEATSLWDYSLHHAAAYQNKFKPLDRIGNSAMTGLSYAYHFDAGRYARFLRKTAENLGVIRREGKVVRVNLDQENGHIKDVALESGEKIPGDLFIDCSGFRALLIGKALKVKYQDWSNWLPCNRAVAVGCEKTDPLRPYTKATAHEAGWQWRIPLQSRSGNGHVFCDTFIDSDAATETLLKNLDGKPTSDPKVLTFCTGRRENFWDKNCVSLGLASGFLEPLESTSIHLIQSNVSALIELFPSKNFGQANIDEYNRRASKEYDLVRDFLILHYHQTNREDSEFWRYCRNMSVPDSLQAKMDLFVENGYLFKDSDDLFRESSWVQVMIGQGLVPKGHHIMADRITDLQLADFLKNVRAIIDKTIVNLPLHEAFLSAYTQSDLQ